jgi:integrase/recombinase XerD
LPCSSIRLSTSSGSVSRCWSVREPLTQQDADRLAQACDSTQEKLIIWPLLDCGLRVSELCGLTPKNIQWQQRSLRIKGKGGPFGTRSKNRVVPMSVRVRTIFEPYFALNDNFPVGVRQAQKIVKRVANNAKLTAEVTPHILRHTFATTFIQKGGSLAALKKIPGHDRLTTTEIYLNLTDEHIVQEYEQKW